MKNFLGQKLLFITAHPDDESYAVAGTIYKNYLAGGWNVLVCASYGEKGTSHLKKKVPVFEFKKIREKELKKAAKLLHIAPVHILGISDGKLRKNKSKIYKRGARYVRQHKPQAIVGFSSDGISGHYDHISVGEVAQRIAKRFKIPFYAFTLPPPIAKNAIKWLKSRRTNPHYAKTVRYQRPTVRIKIDPTMKKRALRCHKSQMDGTNAFTGFPGYAVKELLKAEYFVVK
jgi:LmbE family N-acetylglucosaminyl deacetylase